MDSTYVIDPSDRIIAVNELWVDFAASNGAMGLESRVVGESLWRFIADATVRELYRALVSRVRTTNRHVALCFRCDSPAVRRFMVLSIGPASGTPGTIAFCARMVREEPQPAAARSLYAAVAGHPHRPPSRADVPASVTSSVLSMCSTCKRVDVDGWYEIDEAMERRADLLTEPVRPISHGLCPTCCDVMLASLE